MAKLEGVKTLDMVNGEITKVEYDGGIYEYTDSEEEFGDIALVVNSWGNQEVGEFYIVLKDRHPFYANNSDECVHIKGKRVIAVCYREYVRLYRKVSEPAAPTIESVNAKVDEIAERVEALEGAKKETPTFNVGDRVMTLANGENGEAMAGDVGIIDDIIDRAREEGDPYYIAVNTDDGSFDYFRPQDIELVTEEEGSETITFEGAEYTLVDRKAQPGDVVVFTENESTCFESYTPYGEVKKNEIGELIVKSEVGNSFKVYTYTFNRTPDNVKVYAPVVDEEPYQPAEGDIVVITANTNFSRNKVGDIGKVGKVCSRDSEAKVVVPNRPDDLYINGNWTKFSEMRPATDEEKAQYEKAVKFTRLGRKPNEYKKGDIVRVTDREQSGHKAGTIGEVVAGDGDGRPLVRVIYDAGYVEDLYSFSELIAPVESRIDLVDTE